MLKLLAVLRTIFLVFIIGYTLRAMPFIAGVARTFDEQYAVCSSSVHLLVRAAWLAIGWIAFETVVGWILATRKPARSVAASSNPNPNADPTSNPLR